MRLTFFSQGPPDVNGTNIPSHLFGSQDKAYQKDQVATLSMEKSFSHPTWRKEPWAEGHLLQTFFQDLEVDKAGSTLPVIQSEPVDYPGQSAITHGNVVNGTWATIQDTDMCAFYTEHSQCVSKVVPGK